MADAEQTSDAEFEIWARQRMREMREEATKATRALGLPPETKFDVLRVMYRSGLLPQAAPREHAVASPSEAAVMADQGPGALETALEWLIGMLFPRRPGLGAMGTMSSSASRAAARTEEHRHEQTGLRLVATLREDARGVTADVDVQVNRADGSPVAGARIVLDTALSQPQETVTDSEGRASFPDLLNLEPEAWQLRVDA